MKVNAFTDGAARGNPGESGIGVVLKDEHGKTLRSLYGYTGIATNNVAEYIALLTCVQAAAILGCSALHVHSDSELIVRQMRGEYKVKDAGLKKYFQKIHSLLSGAPFEFEITHIARENNSEADRLANFGIDSRVPVRL